MNIGGIHPLIVSWAIVIMLLSVLIDWTDPFTEKTFSDFSQLKNIVKKTIGKKYFIFNKKKGGQDRLSKFSE